MTSANLDGTRYETGLRGWKLAAARAGWLIFFAGAVVTLLWTR
ncbi:MAG: hypothetical protein R2844_03070 [Caldilineales bacterium]